MDLVDLVDLVELRRIAEAATAGPWHVDRMSCYIWGPKEEMVADRGGPDGVPDGAVVRIRGVGGKLPIDANMAHIAAASPSTVLALLDRIESLEEGLHNLQEVCMGQGGENGLPLFQLFAEEFGQGSSARFEGLSIDTCPIPEGVRRDAWHAGWCDEDAIQNDGINP